VTRYSDHAKTVNLNLSPWEIAGLDLGQNRRARQPGLLHNGMVGDPLIATKITLPLRVTLGGVVPARAHASNRCFLASLIIRAAARMNMRL
jgi:hypothetical protein